MYMRSENFQKIYCQIVTNDDKYVFDDIGYNFIPSETAAFALIQKNLNEIFRMKDNFSILECP